MKTWEIDTGNKIIKVKGRTIEHAVAEWAKKQRSGMSVTCGLLVRVFHKGKISYWSGERFLECLG